MGSTFMPQTMQEWMRKQEKRINILERRRLRDDLATQDFVDSEINGTTLLLDNSYIHSGRFLVYSGFETPRLHRVGDWVTLTTGIYTSAAARSIANGATEVLTGLNIPTEYRPANGALQFGKAATAALADVSIRVNASGQMAYVAHAAITWGAAGTGHYFSIPTMTWRAAS